MNEFAYMVIASALHDPEKVDLLFADYEPFFTRLGAVRRLREQEKSPEEPIFFFILTGGTEGETLREIQRLGMLESRSPVILVAHPFHNSLAASLEILARVRQEGGKGRIILMQSPADARAADEMRVSAGVCRAMRGMRGATIGAIGKPSEWLIASSQGAEAISSAWGCGLRSIPIEDLLRRIEEIQSVDSRKARLLGKSGLSFLRAASFSRDTDKDDMYMSETIYRALKDMIGEYKLDAVSLRCFDLLTECKATGCYSLSLLADQGIDAGCEGDIPSIIGLMWMRRLSGSAAWMANPSNIRAGGNGTGKLNLAHCTVPRSILTEYGIRSHFESGIGLSIAGTFASGPVTLARIGGKGLDKVWVAEGELLESPHEEGLCRTQAVIGLENGELEKLLETPLGNHVVMAMGQWKDKALRFAEFAGLEAI